MPAGRVGGGKENAEGWVRKHIEEGLRDGGKGKSPGRGLPRSPYVDAGFFSRMTFAFVGALLDRGKEATLLDEDLDALDPRDESVAVVGNLEAEWERQLRTHPSEPSLWAALFRSRTNLKVVIVSGILAAGESTTRISQPVVMGFLIQWLSNGGAKERGYGEGFQWAAVLILISFIQAVIHHQLYFFTMRGGWNCKVACQGLVQRKLQRLAVGAKIASNAVINLVSNDVQRFDEFCIRGHFGWTAPLEVIAVFLLMWWKLGILPATSGTGVLVLTIPLQVYFGRRFAIQRKITAGITDLRVRKTAEIFTGIATVKAYCWERPLTGQIQELRDRERASIFISQRMKAFNITTYLVTPALASLATFSVFWAQGERLEVATVFSTLALLQILRVSIGKQFAGFIESFPECLVSVERIRQFLLQPEAGNNRAASHRKEEEAGAEGEEDRLEEAKTRGGGGNNDIAAIPLRRLGDRGSTASLPSQGMMSGAASRLALLSAAEADASQPSVPFASGEGKGISRKKAGASTVLLEKVTFGFPGSLEDKSEAKDGVVSSGRDEEDLEAKEDPEADTAPEIAPVRRVAVSDIDLEVKEGELVMVLGPVGAGKSSLLQGILGELPSLSGSLSTAGSVCLCGQNGWIMATNLRQNILFGLPLDIDRYAKVIEVCGLVSDLKQLPNGDLTQLGERGVNLSGGQKARVALARAAYSGRSLCLLDDPLSAVDPHVMHQLFERCILDFLVKQEKRAVILVTHHAHYAARADRLLIIGQLGNPVFYGPPNECPEAVLKTSTVDEEKERKHAGGEKEKNDSIDDAKVTKWTGTSAAETHTKSEAGVAKKESGDDDGGGDDEQKKMKMDGEKNDVTVFIKSEERSKGQVLWSTYSRYAAMSGWTLVAVSLFLFALAQATVLMAEFWLKIWAEQDNQQQPKFLYAYIGITAALVIIATVRSVLFYEVNLRGASQLHERSFHAVLRSPMTFFHTNPLGRILNKFSSDLGQIDELLPVILFDVVQLSFTSLAAFIVVCIAIPYMAILAIPLIGAFMMLRGRFLASSRELKRLESINKSPLFAAFAAQLRGLVTIRAYGAQARLIREFNERLDMYGRAWYAWLLANRWIGFRLDMLSFTVLACAALGAVATSDSIDPGLAGIALTYAILLSGGFQYLVRRSARAETMMTSVERMLYYTSLPNEGNLDDDSSRKEASDRNPSWPEKGSIEVRRLEVRYRDDLPLVLKGVDFKVPGGSNVGIVGRTGSGKSSFLNALLRLNFVTGGKILLDGVDTLKIGLHTLRRNISWIPQEPHLFSGSLRDNLDPFKQRMDDEIWEVLRAVQMSSKIERSGKGLGFVVGDSGSNLSVGQRQLLSLARAMLERAKVVIMDEATANIDLKTDLQIQKALTGGGMGTLKGSTVIMIAHRVRTIIGCDQVVVLDNGRVKEFGSPASLVQREGGIFKSMVLASGMDPQKIPGVKK